MNDPSSWRPRTQYTAERAYVSAGLAKQTLKLTFKHTHTDSAELTGEKDNVNMLR